MRLAPMLWYKKCHKKSSNAKQHYHLLFLKYAKQHHLMIKYDQNFNTSDIISLKAGYNRLREREMMATAFYYPGSLPSFSPSYSEALAENAFSPLS